MEERSWMERDRRRVGCVTPEFELGVNEFIHFSLSKPNYLQDGKVRCPCRKCHNTKYLQHDLVVVHLLHNGFVDNYHVWEHQGEGYVEPPVMGDGYAEDETVLQEEEGNHRYVEMVLDIAGPNFIQRDIEDEEPNAEDKQFFDMLNSAKQKLWTGCENMTQLGAVARMLDIKSEDNLSERCFNKICALIQDILPEDNGMVASFYETKKLAAGLGLPVEKIDCCELGCMLFWNTSSGLTECTICGKSRYKLTKKGCVPVRYMFYFPLTYRLKRLYLSKYTAAHMTWHLDHSHVDPGEMCHPSDSEAWKNFDSIHPSFAADGRNVRLGLSTDGFNPFGQTGSQYSCWPVIVAPYNLPPNLCMKEESLFLTAICPGGANPKKKLDVYLQPLIHELIGLWNEGVECYDVSRKENFTLRACLMWTITDFPANAMVSGWGTAGITACPCCMEETKSIRLLHGSKQSWFDAHRRFLPMDHPFRTDTVNFRKDLIETRAPPRIRTGQEVLADIENWGLKKVTDPGGELHNNDVSTCNNCGWRKRGIFWDLPYWKTNLIRHNLDVMHIEKNVFDNIFHTVMDTQGKTKDNAKAREDIKLLCNRKELEYNPRTGKYPKANYSLTKDQRKQLLMWIKEVRFPDGYVSNLSRCVDNVNNKIYGMKSHDCHVFMQRLLPVAFKEFLPRQVWEAITELSNFFRCLSARVINRADMEKLERDIPLIICKLECIFPPSVFDCMEHLPIHLATEAKLGGPVQFRWMYPYERSMSRWKKMVKNKARVEGSICNAYLVREASLFCSHYFEEHVQTRRRTVPRADDGGVPNVDPSLPSIFKYPGRAQGKYNLRRLIPEEWHAAHTYVMMNCTEIDPYVKLYEEFLHQSQPHISSEDVAIQTSQHFASWFQNYANENRIESQVIRDIAFGPMRTNRVYSMYFINGYRFQTDSRSEGRACFNSGVCIASEDSEYFGRIVDIIELEYHALPTKKCVVFKCEWYDPTINVGTRVYSKYNLVEVHSGRRLRSYDPFILAAQATQCCYLRYPGAVGSHADWLAICAVRPRGWLEAINDNKIIDAFQSDRELQFDLEQTIELQCRADDVHCQSNIRPIEREEEDEDNIDEPIIESGESDNSSDSDYH